MQRIKTHYLGGFAYAWGNAERGYDVYLDNSDICQEDDNLGHVKTLAEARDLAF